MASPADQRPVLCLWPAQSTDSFYVLRDGYLIQVPVLSVCCCTSRSWFAIPAATSLNPSTSPAAGGPGSMASRQDTAAAAAAATQAQAAPAAGLRANERGTARPSPHDVMQSVSRPLCPVCSAPLIKPVKHFSVAVCDGCKSFFRRCAARSSALQRCPHGGVCPVQPDNRRKCCRACRYQRCLSVGMRAPASSGASASPLSVSSREAPPPAYEDAVAVNRRLLAQTVRQ